MDDEWQAKTDPASGHTYYVNRKTGERSWEKPDRASFVEAANTRANEIVGAQSESVVLSTRDLAEPTNAEVLGYAVEQLGINPETEPQLLWIARKALKAKLPDGWGPCASPEGEVRF